MTAQREREPLGRPPREHALGRARIDDGEHIATSPVPQAHRALNPPSGFDSALFPIIGLHFFGIAPTCGDDIAIQRDLQFRRNVARLHARGPRILLEYLLDVGAARNILTFLENRIADFAALDPDVLAALGADNLPPTPLHRIEP